ncbi:MAG: hypothetical protein LBH05_06900 [Deferribacteraceae bacterium]|jgi:hypothetical protein|nr:hypothetical protein [Deferribacteraceae bacterium]
METITFVEVENYQIIASINTASPDPEETNTKVDAVIAKNPDILLRKTREELLTENMVFARLGQGQKNVDDDEGKKLEGIFDKLDQNEKLLLSGEVIADLRNTEYWIKQSGVWSKQKIERLGEALLPKAVLPEKLSQIQQSEIAEQTEAARLADLTPDQKTEEKEAALTAAKQEVRRLKEEAEIADEPFDAKAEYQLRKTKKKKKICVISGLPDYNNGQTSVCTRH